MSMPRWEIVHAKVVLNVEIHTTTPKVNVVIYAVSDVKQGMLMGKGQNRQKKVTHMFGFLLVINFSSLPVVVCDSQQYMNRNKV